MKYASMIVLFWGISMQAHATAQEINNFSANAALCASYFTFIETCLSNSGNNTAAKEYGDLGNLTLYASIAYSNDATAKARLDTFGTQIMNLCEGRCENIARAIAAHGEYCMDFVDTLPSVLNKQN